MAGIWQSRRDNLKNGTILGMLVAVAMIWGNKVYSWFLINAPASWTQTIPLWAWLMGGFALVGYIIDKK